MANEGYNQDLFGWQSHPAMTWTCEQWEQLLAEQGPYCPEDGRVDSFLLFFAEHMSLNANNLGPEQRQQALQDHLVMFYQQRSRRASTSEI